LSDAFQEIGAEFHKQNPGVLVEFNFAGSQQLAQQIAQGAPADIFASANKKQMDILIQEVEVAAGQEKVFAQNRLVVIFPIDNPAKINRLEDLAKPGIKVLIAAKEVPAGQYALEYLAKASQAPGFGPAYQQSVLNNVVSYEENVRGVLRKVGLGEADAGIVYLSDTRSPGGEPVGSLDIPDSLNSVASYPIAPLANSRSQDRAAAFIQYVLSPAGQAILQKYGFLPAAP
jgi:molybdate transport system substrate-binding protein